MKTGLRILLLVALVFCVPAITAVAEDTDSSLATSLSLRGARNYVGHPYGYYPYGYNPYLRGRAAWFYGAGAYLQGRGQLVRDRGEAEYLRSLAQINREQARQHHIENRQLYAETYFNMKRVNRDARQELAPPRATAEDYARYAKDRLPEVLSGQQYDRDHGLLIWPAVLLQERFADDRGLIESLIAQRANARFASDIDSEIAQATSGMLQTLRVKGQDLNSTDFITAMKFIKSLNYEVRVHPTLAPEHLAGSPALNSLASR